MKRFNKILMTAFLMVLSTSPLLAQRWLEMWKDPQGHNFFEIQKEFNDYFATHQPGKGTGYNQFKRWEYYMEPRVGEDGTIMNPQMKTFSNYLEYLQARTLNDVGQKTTSLNGDWTFFGAQDHFKGTSGYNGGIGRVNIVAFDPSNDNIIYIGAPAAGLWKTTTGGSNWTPLTDGTAFWGVSGICVDPVNTNIIYILTGDGDGGSSRSAGVWKTTNGGTTWSATGLFIDYVTSSTDGYKLLMDPSNNNILYAVMTSGLWKTTDAGVTWTNVKTGSYRDMEFRPGNSSVLYLTGGNAIHRSLDAGATWTQVYTVAGASRIALGVTPANSQYLYALAGPNNGTGAYYGVHRSVDGGTNWTVQSTTPNILGYSNTGNDASSQATYDLAIAVSPSNANVIHTGGINVWTSTNGGTTMTIQSYWVEGTPGYQYTHADIHELVYRGENLYCGSDGGVYRTTNGGTNWSDISAGLGITEWYRFGGTPQNASLYIGGAQDNGTNKLEAPIPDLVMEHLYGADGMEAAIDPSNVSIMYSTSQGGGLKRSNNAGNNWTGIAPTNLGGGGWVTPFAINPWSPNHILAGYTDVGVHYTQGTPTSNWINLSSGAVGGGICNHITYAPSDTTHIYVVKSSSVYRTTNSGSTWTNITAGLPGGTYSYIAVDPADRDLVYVTRQTWTANNKIWRSTNGGTTWTNISGTALPNVPANCVTLEAGTDHGIYLGTDAGVYYLNDGLSDWVDFSNGLPFCRVMEMEINPLANRLRAATYGRSVWESDLYGETCQDDLVLSGILSGTQVIEANLTITSTNTIDAGANVTFSAGTMITLNPGFTMLAGAEFHAVMDGCTSGKMQASPVAGNYVPPVVPADASGSKPMEGFAIANYPNPFRGHTYITYELPTASPVRLDLFNMNAQLITNIATEAMQEKGRHTVRLDALDLPGGTYFVRFTAGDHNSYLKLVVAR